MLRLSPRQIDAMNRQADDAFVAAVAKVLREELPQEVAHLPDVPLEETVRADVRSAKMSGLDMEEDILLFVMAARRLSPQFPGDMPALHDILSNDGVPYDERNMALACALAEARR